MNEIGQMLFECGKVLLKLDRSKSESATLIRALNGPAEEQILQQRIAKFWNQRSLWDRPDGLLLVTNHRVVFLTKQETVVTTTNFLSFPLEMIEGLAPSRVWGLVPAVRFRVQRMLFVFTLLTGAESMYQAIQGAQAAARAGTN